MRPVAAVVNPTKIDDLGALRAQLERAAGPRTVLWLETTAEDPGNGQTEQALEQGADLILACGGDGTVTACASALAGTTTALALVPAGTGNLLARNLELPTTIAPALEIAFGTGRRAIDVVRCEPGRHFMVMAGIGFDASMIEQTNEDTKSRVGWPAYIGGIVRAIRDSRRTRFSIGIDGQPARSYPGVGVLIGNAGDLQAGLSMFPDATMDDGRIDLAVLSPRGWQDWPLILGRLIGHRMGAGGRTELLQGRRFEISCERELPLEFDGDLFGPTTSLIAEVLPGGVTVCVPA